ncbi:MAG: divalent-cation tolerance protein CutA [Deltaproteobacteria bacterium]|nr:divalent-cation tolerance protein CutA [Deltaproteobacteria bacterium]
MKGVVILSTAASKEEAERLAEALVRQKLAACVNLVPGVTSFFHWDGKLNREEEIFLIIKTTDEKSRRVGEVIRELHSYEVPEMIYWRLDGGSADYLKWLEEATREEGA